MPAVHLLFDHFVDRHEVEKQGQSGDGDRGRESVLAIVALSVASRDDARLVDVPLDPCSSFFLFLVRTIMEGSNSASIGVTFVELLPGTSLVKGLELLE